MHRPRYSVEPEARGLKYDVVLCLDDLLREQCGMVAILELCAKFRSRYPIQVAALREMHDIESGILLLVVVTSTLDGPYFCYRTQRGTGLSKDSCWYSCEVGRDTEKWTAFHILPRDRTRVDSLELGRNIWRVGDMSYR
jgi:hypothetical protein